MDATTPYEFIGFGAMDATKPYEFIRSGAMDATKPYEFIGNENYNVYVVFGRFPAELGSETRSNGSGSKNVAERTQN